MKKITILLLSLSVVLSLCGCDNTASKNDSGKNMNSSEPAMSNGTNTVQASAAPGESSNPANSGNPEASEAPTQNDSELRLIYDSDIFLNALTTSNCTENGYYSVKSLGTSYWDDKFLNLTYVDFASHREVVLCSDSSCKHDNEKCASYLSSKDFLSIPGVFINGDYLYLLSTEYDQSGSMSSGGGYTAPGYEPPEETRRASIYRMNLDGTNRQKIWEADNVGDVIEANVFGDGNDIWFITKTPAMKIYENPESKKNGAVFYYSKNRALMKYSSSENKITERIPLDDYNNIALDVMGCKDGKLILSGTAYPNGTSIWDNMEILAPSPNFGDSDSATWEFMEKWEEVYFTFDLATKEIRETFRKTLGELYALDKHFFDGGRLYMIGEDYSVCAADLQTGEISELNVPKGYRLDGFFLDKMCFTRITENWDDNKTYITDLNGENMTASEFVSATSFGNDYVLLGLTSDKAVIIYETEKIPSVNNPGAYTVGKRKAGLISIIDMLNGQPNFEPIDALKETWD